MPASVSNVFNLLTCQAVWSPKYLLSMSGELILNDKQHILYLPTLHRYNTRSRDGLWWYVTSHTIREKRVVRSWASRRLRHAIVEALRDQGLDEGGKVLAHSSTDAEGGPTPFALRGTLRVTAMPPLMLEKYSVVQKEAKEIISHVIDRSRT